MITNNIETVASHCDLRAPKGLKSLWIEIPDYCHLCCSYCFASTNRNHPKKNNDWLQEKDYYNLIDQFAKQGGKFIGIPGRGEPFHKHNEVLVKKIVSKAFEKGLITTIFTTGDTLLFRPRFKKDKSNGYHLWPERRRTDDNGQDLIDFLGTRNVILLIKYNSAKNDIQDKIVGTHNYTKYRELALQELTKRQSAHKNDAKWNLQIGIVTSILKNNINEIEELYDRFNLNTGYIFDCDTILPRGRGESYKHSNNLSHEDLNKVLTLLKKKGAIQGCQGGTYVGIACDRIFHHLYVSLIGNVYPCIGCFENHDLKNKLCLGNIKQDQHTLSDCNNHFIKTKLRERPQDVFSGVCFNCQNFKNQTCFSCLGRCAIDVTVANDDLLINTCGCTNHRPILSEWINQAVDYLRTILSYEKTKKMLDQNLEELWKPNQNLAFKLHQLSRKEAEQEIDKIIRTEDTHDQIVYDPDISYSQNPIERFSFKKHYKYSDLFFPLNKVWDFIKQPPIIYNTKEEQEILMGEFTKSYLSNIFLSSLKILLEKHDSPNSIQPDNNVMFCNILLYDNDKRQYFYRTISKGKLEDDSEFKRSLILFRWAENIDNENYFSDDSKGKIFNASSILRNEFYKEYELILERDNHEILETSDSKFDFTSFISSELITKKVNAIEDFFQNQVFNKGGYWFSVETFINTKKFSELKNNEKEILINLFNGLNSCLFSSGDRDLIKSKIIDGFKQFILDNCKDRLTVEKKLKTYRTLEELQQINEDDNFKSSNKSLSRFFDLLKKENSKNEIISTFNYIVFLGYLHRLGINYYTLFHSANFKNVDEKYTFITTDSYGYGNIINPSGILICSKNKLSRDFRSDLSLFISNIFQPLDEYYFNKLIRRHKSFEEHLKAHQHTIFNLFPHIKYNLTWIKKEVEELLNNDINESGDELKKLIDEEERVLSILDFILKDSLQKQTKNHNCLHNKSYIEIINDIRKYCILLREESSENSEIYIQYVDEDNGLKAKTYMPEEKQTVDVFTVFYNLLINANKASFYKHPINIKVKSLQNDILKISISNYGVPLGANILNYINNPDKNAPPRPDSGLAIVIKKIRTLEWIISANIEDEDDGLLKTNKIIVKIPLKCKQ